MVEGFVRKRLVAYLEEATGGRVEIATFHWRLLDLEADAGGLVIHGREAAGEAPYAQAERLRAQISILGLLSPRILLRDLELSRPHFTSSSIPTAQPTSPCHASRAKLESPRSIPYSTSRPAAFHSVGEFSTTKIGPQPLTSRTASSRSTSTPRSLLLISYVPAATGNLPAQPESFHIEAGASDLNLFRGKAQPAHGYFQATLDLTRKAAYLRSLRITSMAHGSKDHTVEISGALNDFADPRWQGKARAIWT